MPKKPQTVAEITKEIMLEYYGAEEAGDRPAMNELIATALKAERERAEASEKELADLRGQNAMTEATFEDYVENSRERISALEEAWSWAEKTLNELEHHLYKTYPDWDYTDGSLGDQFKKHKARIGLIPTQERCKHDVHGTDCYECFPDVAPKPTLPSAQKEAELKEAIKIIDADMKHAANYGTQEKPSPAAEESHFVSGCCKGELCRACHKPAKHKLEEAIFPDESEEAKMRHGLTAYVCCEHFKLIVGPCAPCNPPASLVPEGLERVECYYCQMVPYGNKDCRQCRGEGFVWVRV